MNQTGAKLILAVGLSSLASGCEKIEKHINKVLTEQLTNASLALETSIGQLDGVIDQQRTSLSGELQTLLETTALNLHALADQVDQSVDSVLVTGQNLEERTTADLTGAISSITRASDALVLAVKSGADDTIRRAVRDFERERTVMIQQINGATQANLRPAIAQLQRSGDKWVGQLGSAVSEWIVRGIGCAVMLAGIIAMAVALGRKNRAFAIGSGAAAAVGLALVVAAVPISLLGRKTVEIPDGQATCDGMLAIASKLDAYDKRGTRMTVAEAQAASQGSATRTFVRSTLDAPTAPGLSGGSEPRLAIATEVLRAANQCLTYATTAPMAKLAERTLTRALAVLGGNVICQTMGDCEVLGQACDALIQICVPWGEYCDSHADCVEPMSCNERHRCTGSASCTSPVDCAPSLACDPRMGRCVSPAAVDTSHEACTVTSPDVAPGSPCATGEWRVVSRVVRCVQTKQRTTEVCDNVDNDCNGTIDEGMHRPAGCDHGVGECRSKGTWACTAGQWSCAAATPQIESCDGKDNDCDGAIDDVAAQGACRATNARGECANGTQFCGCVASAPSPETCDAKDNDCDGNVDPVGVCPERVIWTQGPDDRNRELTRSPNLPTDLIDTQAIVGPHSCGRDALGRAFHRTSVSVAADSVHGATCTFAGWESSDTRNCRIHVRFKTVRWGSNVWCRGEWSGAPAGPAQP